MSTDPEPAGSPGPEVSEAAQLARLRLHEEIERVRRGVEEMLDERGGGSRGGGGDRELRRELEELRLETRTYVKRKVRKSEKRLRRSVRELEARADELEQRIDRVAGDRAEAEWRIHNSTERMLDGLLVEVRAIADRLSGQALPPVR
jgi:chromosome segregation ATPase